jgi:hypothetical protein
MKCLEWSPKPDADSSQRANLLLAHPSGISVAEPWYLLSNLDPTLNLVWSYAQRFCCEQLFSSQKSEIFQLESIYVRDPARIDRLLLLLAIANMRRILQQGYTVSLACESCRVDPHWQRGMSFVRIGLQWLQKRRSQHLSSLACLAAHPPCRIWSPVFPVAASNGGRKSHGSRGLTCRHGHGRTNCWLSHDCRS